MVMLEPVEVFGTFTIGGAAAVTVAGNPIGSPAWPPVPAWAPGWSSCCCAAHSAAASADLGAGSVLLKLFIAAALAAPPRAAS
jgi:hypothetical protein